jgi:hypothetical protein
MKNVFCKQSWQRAGERVSVCFVGGFISVILQTVAGILSDFQSFVSNSHFYYDKQNPLPVLSVAVITFYLCEIPSKNVLKGKKGSPWSEKDEITSSLDFNFRSDKVVGISAEKEH